MMTLINFFKNLYDFYYIRWKLKKGRIITMTFRVSNKFLEHAEPKVMNLLADNYIHDFKKKYKVKVKSTVVRGHVGDDFINNESTVNIYLEKK